MTEQNDGMLVFNFGGGAGAATPAGRRLAKKRKSAAAKRKKSGKASGKRKKVGKPKRKPAGSAKRKKSKSSGKVVAKKATARSSNNPYAKKK